MEPLGEWPMNGVETVTMVTGFVEFLVWAQGLALLALALIVFLHCRPSRSRRFWCALARRQVEVEFDRRGLPGLRRAVGVSRCSVFEPPEAITCGRRCLDPTFRRQWEPALPLGAG